jgi:hypothetical protein
MARPGIIKTLFDQSDIGSPPRPGQCSDNALTESFNTAVKIERANHAETLGIAAALATAAGIAGLL